MCKSRVSSTSTLAPTDPKRRKTSIHPPKQCDVRIKIEVRVGPEEQLEYTIFRYAPVPRRGVSREPDASIPVHSHDLDKSDFRKQNSALEAIITKQLLNHVSPGQIYKNLFGIGLIDGDKRICEAGGRHIDVDKICNIEKLPKVKQHLETTDNRVFRSTWEQDLVACRDFLENNGYLSTEISAQIAIPPRQRVSAEGTRTRTCFGLVFAKETRLQQLAQFGYLTVMDSTHGTNIHGFNLFTVMVRDSYGTWIPAAHALVESECGELISKTIRTLRDWTANNWKPRYFLTDDSAAEQLGVRMAFKDSGFKVDHLLCVFHSMQTLIRRLSSHPESLELLRRAIFVKTSFECESLISQSIQSLREWNMPRKESRDTMERYIRQNWFARREQWAMYARQHCRILLQV